jgi:hypothetical protein
MIGLAAARMKNMHVIFKYFGTGTGLLSESLSGF